MGVSRALGVGLGLGRELFMSSEHWLLLFGETGGVGVCVGQEGAGVRPEVEGGYGSNTWLRKTLRTSGLLSGLGGGGLGGVFGGQLARSFEHFCICS